MISLTPSDALLIIDIQNDFLPGGTLGVSSNDKLIPVLGNDIRRFQDHDLPIVLTRDWHPPDHCSFQSQGGPWPIHCVAGSPGSLPPPSFGTPPSAVIISKAIDRDQETYSAFQRTTLDQHLRALNTQRLFIGGLATDYCVLNSVKDPRALVLRSLSAHGRHQGGEPPGVSGPKKKCFSWEPPLCDGNCSTHESFNQCSTHGFA